MRWLLCLLLPSWGAGNIVIKAKEPSIFFTVPQAAPVVGALASPTQTFAMTLRDVAPIVATTVAPATASTASTVAPAIAATTTAPASTSLGAMAVSAAPVVKGASLDIGLVGQKPALSLAADGISVWVPLTIKGDLILDSQTFYANGIAQWMIFDEDDFDSLVIAPTTAVTTVAPAATTSAPVATTAAPVVKTSLLSQRTQGFVATGEATTVLDDDVAGQQQLSQLADQAASEAVETVEAVAPVGQAVLAPGWSDGRTSVCRGNTDRMLGGHCQFGSTTTSRKYTKLPAHTRLHIRARVHFFDKWQGEAVWLKMNGLVVWQDSHRWCRSLFESHCHQFGLDSCGRHWPDKLSSVLAISLDHTGDATLEFGSTLKKGTDACQVSWGVDDVALELQ